jgi:hypothetical protein
MRGKESDPLPLLLIDFLFERKDFEFEKEKTDQEKQVLLTCSNLKFLL